jgi:phosphatidyl-myo-inositol alpha-mannosyltransferase
VRILQACPYSWHTRGGVQSHVRSLTAALRSRGHAVLIVAPGDPAAAPEEGLRLVGRPFGVPFNGSVAPVILDPRVAGRVRRALRDFDADILHLHEPYSSMMGFATVMARVPIVITCHAAVEHSVARAALRLLVTALRPLRPDFDACLAVSAEAAASGRRGAGQEPQIVPNGTDFDRLSTAAPALLPSGRRLLFLGRLEPRKGLQVALEAFARLAPERPDLWFILAGDGAGRDLPDRLPPAVRARVLRLGDVTADLVPALYAAADVFVAPATGRESFGMALLDAMAAGRPIVASDLPAYRHLLDGGAAGLLVPPQNPEALAAAVGSLLDAPGDAAALGVRARARAEAYAWPRVAARIERIYERVLAGRLPVPATLPSRSARRAASPVQE